MFYVYEHIRNDTNTIFYVGKGNGNRLNSIYDRNRHWNFIVKKAGGFKSNKIIETNDENFALFVEMEVIDLYKKRGIKLCNITNGGEGLSGYKHTEESKNKVRQAALNRIHYKHTEETKEKIRKANTGVIFTDERKRKIAEKAKGRKMSDATKEKMNYKNRNYKHSLETLDKMCKIQREMPKRKCFYCDFVGNAGNLKRWHMDNCKFKGKLDE